MFLEVLDLWLFCGSFEIFFLKKVLWLFIVFRLCSVFVRKLIETVMATDDR